MLFRFKRPVQWYKVTSEKISFIDSTLCNMQEKKSKSKRLANINLLLNF